jgi:hypothetical protein
MEMVARKGSGVVFGDNGNHVVKRTTENDSRPPRVPLATKDSIVNQPGNVTERFLMGDDLLVAPMVKEGARNR